MRVFVIEQHYETRKRRTKEYEISSTVDRGGVLSLISGSSASRFMGYDPLYSICANTASEPLAREFAKILEEEEDSAGNTLAALAEHPQLKFKDLRRSA